MANAGIYGSGNFGSGSYGAAQNQGGVYGAGVYGSILPVRVTPNFNDATAQANKSQSGYNQWSERAIVQNYNSLTDSYEIVISAQNQQGASSGSQTGAILTNVKATIPASVNQFSPGDSVLVGYVAGQREHPIIIGGGDHTGQVAPVVTLPNVNQPQGASTPALASTPASQTPTCAMQLIDPNTNSTSSITIDCTQVNPDGSLFFPIPPYVSCGVGDISWTATAPGVSVSAGITVSGSGPHNSLLTIKPPPNSGGGVPGVAYSKIVSYFQSAGAGAPCGLGENALQSDYLCDDTKGLNQCYNDPPPGLCSGVPWDCGITPLCQGDGTFICSNCGHSGTRWEEATLGSLICATCQAGDTYSCDRRTGSMIIAGCNPCGVSMKGGLITATDSSGRFVTVTIR